MKNIVDYFILYVSFLDRGNDEQLMKDENYSTGQLLCIVLFFEFLSDGFLLRGKPRKSAHEMRYRREQLLPDFLVLVTNLN